MFIRTSGSNVYIRFDWYKNQCTSLRAAIRPNKSSIQSRDRIKKHICSASFSTQTEWSIIKSTIQTKRYRDLPTRRAGAGIFLNLIISERTNHFPATLYKLRQYERERAAAAAAAASRLGRRDSRESNWIAAAETTPHCCSDDCALPL